MAVLSVVAGIAVIRPGAGAPGTTIVAAPPTSASVGPTAPGAAPQPVNAGSMGQLLTAAVPAPYTAQPVPLVSATGDGSAPFAWLADANSQYYRVGIMVEMRDGGRAGLLTGIIGNDRPAGLNPADPCAVKPDLAVEGIRVDGCSVLTAAGGVPIRLVVGHDETAGTVYAAVRFVGDGYVAIVLSQGVRPYFKQYSYGGGQWQSAVRAGDTLPLTTMPIVPQHVADLAASPAVLP
ncbi:hypothetical protein AB0K00_04040 [Dactylosporangium sp. NPDC049525]|uniref:hypothetical protein n=1 Tax=Dactylosporangium sp. NPDC049525 TaxID=3154730 RepID=UPI00344751E4